MEEVCVELDGVLVKLMECLSQLALLRRRFSEVVSEGYLNMAKARYSMGPLSVNPLHYDTIMTATCLVEVETATCSPKTDGDETTEIDERVTSSVFRVYRYNTANVRGGQGGTHSGSGREGGDGGDSQLRRRRPQTGEPEGVEEVERGEGGGDRERMGEETAEGMPPKNPLNWFGVLVPQSLRQSQENFIQAATLCGEIATQQGRLESLRAQYRTLWLRKQQIK